MTLLMFLSALFKRWWALMGGAAFTFLGWYASAHNKRNAWFLRAGVVLAVLMVLWAAYLAWNDEHKQWLKEAAKNSPRQTVVFSC